MKGRRRSARLEKSSKSLRRILPVRAPDNMNFDLQMKSQLYREFRARQISLGRAFVLGSFSWRAPIIRTILSSRFLSPPSSNPPHFFSICPPSPVLRRRHRSAFSFFLLVGNFRGECRTEKEPSIKFASELNSNYLGVSFARSPRSASSLFSPLRSSDRVLRYALPHVAKNVSWKGTEVETEVKWKSEKRASIRSRAYDLNVIAIEISFLLRARNYFASNWIIDMDRKKVCT